MKRVIAISGVLVVCFCIYNAIHPVKLSQVSQSMILDEPYDNEKAKSDSPDEYEKYFLEITTMEGKVHSGYKAGYRLVELDKARRNRAGMRLKEVSWIERGPGNVAGRTRGLIIHPDDPSGRTWIVGSASGGIWKTEDGGISWQNLTPDLPNLATTTLAMSPANTSIIYAGTGEGFFNSGSVTGDGIFKSIDGGTSWQQIVTAGEFVGLQNVNRIIVDPSDPDVVLACGNGFPPFESGIYRSNDGGGSWDMVYSASARIQQLIFNPKDFNIQYATVNGQGLLKSTDAGVSWQSHGLGLSASGRIEVAISPTDSQKMYASAESGVSGGSSAVFVSDDAGANWQIVGGVTSTTVTEWLGEQGWYDNAISVHPFNANTVYVGGVNLFKAEVSNSIRNKPPTVRGVNEEGTDEFMDFINAGLSNLRGGLGTGEEWFEDHDGFPINFSDSDYRSVEIRFGTGKKQMAHRYTVPTTSGTNSDGGAGVVPLDHIYQDYVEVPFEVWDTDEDRQLMVSFRDQERDGKWNLIQRSEVDPVPGREYIFVNGVSYDAEKPDPNMTIPGGHGFKTLYCMWPTLADGATFDENALPESKLVISYGEVVERISTIEQIASGGIHVDVHNIQMVSTQSGAFKMVVATDGGVHVSNEEADPGITSDDWLSAGVGYNTTQFYGVDKKANAQNYVGGTQDNGTQITFNANPGRNAIYDRKIGGDGFDVVWSYFKPDLVIGGLQNNRIRRSVDGGVTWSSATFGLDDTEDDLAPFFTRLSGHKLLPRTVLTVGQTGVWRSNDFGGSWYSQPINNKWIAGGTVTSALRVEFSLANPNIIWAGSGMTSQRNLHVSLDGGTNYNIVPNIADTIGSISGLATHPFQDSTAYALFSFREYGKVFRTTDLGTTWEDISGFDGGITSTTGFPDVEVNSLIVLPHEPETIWVGTEIGIVESIDNGSTWHLLSGNLPAVSVWEMVAVDDQIVIATHGRGIWTATLDGLLWPIDVVASVEEELEESSIQLYPNPADSRLSVKYQNLTSGKTSLQVVDIKGQIVFSRDYPQISENGEMYLDTSELPDGVYILKLQKGSSTKSRRFLVRH